MRILGGVHRQRDAAARHGHSVPVCDRRRTVVSARIQGYSRRKGRSLGTALVDNTERDLSRREALVAHRHQGLPQRPARVHLYRDNAAVLADTYGDVPCSEAGLGYISGISTPKYDTVEELYTWFFEELDACEKQLGTGTDRISGDVTSMGGDVA